MFPSRRETPLSDGKLSRVLTRLTIPETAHGMRSTFRAWVDEQAVARHPKARDPAERALAHTVGWAVERAYARSDLLERRRTLMADWAAFVTGS